MTDSIDSPPNARSRVGVDTGGTFTDLVHARGDGSIEIAKTPSTPEDPGRALEAGLRDLGIEREEDLSIVHGTTVALNALLTGRVGPAALVTNRGFVDLIEIDRQARPDLYAMEPERPSPLIPRTRRFELDQRSEPSDSGRGAASEGTHGGSPVTETRRPSDAEIAAVCDQVVGSGARSAAVCLLHSYADPEPELRVVRALAARGIEATSSAALLGEYREAERFSTAACNAALVPVVRDYLDRLGRVLASSNLEILQSSGGGLASAQAAREPVRVLLSGPAGGVVGAAHAAEAAGLSEVVTLDMGGTSTDVAFHAPGRALASLAEEVRIAGHSVGVPTLDMHTVGCGGGSLARVDSGGALRVGPASAGAVPGPVAFGRGGETPTVTDAYVVLGLIAPRASETGFLGGRLELDVDAAMRAYAKLGRSLGTDAIGAASAVVEAAGASMRRAIGVMTMQRGRDPRSTPLVAFGGGGGLAGAALAQGLGMPSALIPRAPGVLSAYGMTRAPRTADRSVTVLRAANDMGSTERARRLADLCAEAESSLASAGTGGGPTRFETGLALRYRGQSYELALDGEEPDPVSAFHALHEERFGWRLEGREVELVHLRARAVRVSEPGSAVGTLSSNQASQAPGAPGTPRADGERKVVIGGRSCRAAVLQRDRLTHGDRVEGPAVIDEYSGTTVVPGGATAAVVGDGALLITHDA